MCVRGVKLGIEFKKKPCIRACGCLGPPLYMFPHVHSSGIQLSLEQAVSLKVLVYISSCYNLLGASLCHYLEGGSLCFDVVIPSLCSDLVEGYYALIWWEAL